MVCMCPICKAAPALSSLLEWEQLILSKHPKLSLLMFDVCKVWLEQLQKGHDKLTYNTPSSDFFVFNRYGVSGELYSWCRGDKFHATLWVLLREIKNLIPLEYHGKAYCRVLESMNPIYESFKFSVITKLVPNIEFLVFKKLLEIGQKYFPCQESELEEIQSRDNSNKYIIQKQKSTSAENLLIQTLLREPFINKLLVDRYEWCVMNNWTNMGVGDLVLTNGRGVYLVVEVKYIDLTSTGETARARRTHKRKLVIEQACKYAEKFREVNSAEALIIIPAIYTNQHGLLFLIINYIEQIYRNIDDILYTISSPKLPSVFILESAEKLNERPREREGCQSISLYLVIGITCAVFYSLYCAK